MKMLPGALLCCLICLLVSCKEKEGPWGLKAGQVYLHYDEDGYYGAVVGMYDKKEEVTDLKKESLSKKYTFKVEVVEVGDGYVTFRKEGAKEGDEWYAYRLSDEELEEVEKQFTLQN